MRIGSLVLASVLLGVPRALDARVFGARRPVCRVEVSPRSPGLLAFGEALERALGGVGSAFAPCRSAAVTVVEVLHVASVRDALGRAAEAITLAVTEGQRVRRILLHARPNGLDAAARALLARLSPGDC